MDPLCAVQPMQLVGRVPTSDQSRSPSAKLGVEVASKTVEPWSSVGGGLVNRVRVVTQCPSTEQMREAASKTAGRYSGVGGGLVGRGRIVTQRPSTEPGPVHGLSPHSETADDVNDVADALGRSGRPDGDPAPERDAGCAIVARVPQGQRWCPRGSNEVPLVLQNEKAWQESQLLNGLPPDGVRVGYAVVPLRRQAGSSIARTGKQGAEAGEVSRHPHAHLQLGLLLIRGGGLGLDADGNWVGEERRMVRVVDRLGHVNVGDGRVAIDPGLANGNAEVDLFGVALDGRPRGPCSAWCSVLMVADVQHMAGRRG